MKVTMQASQVKHHRAARLERQRLPLDPAMAGLPQAQAWCLGGGEDFELSRGYFGDAHQVKLPDIFPPFLNETCAIFCTWSSVFQSSAGNARSVPYLRMNLLASMLSLLIL